MSEDKYKSFLEKPDKSNLARIQEVVKEKIKEGKIDKAIDFLNNLSVLFPPSHKAAIFIISNEFKIVNQDYKDKKISRDKWYDEWEKIGLQILTFLQNLSIAKPKGREDISSEIPTAKPFSPFGNSSFKKVILIEINGHNHSLGFSTDNKKLIDRLFLNEKKITAKRNFISYNKSYPFKIEQDEKVYPFELRVKFSLKWGNIKSLELVYDNKNIIYQDSIHQKS